MRAPSAPWRERGALAVLACAALAACTSLEGLVGGADAGAPANGPDATSPDAPAPPADAGADAEAAAPVFAPAPGEYRYVGRGSDKLTAVASGNVLREQFQGPTMTGTVSGAVDGCYTFTLAASATHTWSLELCQRGRALAERGGRDDQTWLLGNPPSTNRATWSCFPENLILGPTVERDKKVPHLCSGTNTTPPDSGFEQGGLLELVGAEVLAVGGVDVPVVHVKVERTVKGQYQRGTQTLELWLAESSLVVRGVRKSAVTTATGFGDVRYDEDSELHLQALTPAQGAVSDGGPDARADARDR